jgi:hypothetical protein
MEVATGRGFGLGEVFNATIWNLRIRTADRGCSRLLRERLELRWWKAGVAKLEVFINSSNRKEYVVWGSTGINT